MIMSIKLQNRIPLTDIFVQQGSQFAADERHVQVFNPQAAILSAEVGNLV